MRGRSITLDKISNVNNKSNFYNNLKESIEDKLLYHLYEHVSFDDLLKIYVVEEEGHIIFDLFKDNYGRVSIYLLQNHNIVVIVASKSDTEEYYVFMYSINKERYLSYPIDDVDILHDLDIVAFNFQSKVKYTHGYYMPPDDRQEFTKYIDSVLNLDKINLLKFLLYDRYK